MRGFVMLFCTLPILALALVACGGGGSATSTTTTSGPSSATVQAVEVSIFQSMVAAFKPSSSSLSIARRFAANDAQGVVTTGGCNPPPLGPIASVCNITISGSDTSDCTGGSTAVAGSVTGTIQPTTGGTLNFSLTATPMSCGTQGWVVSGNPNLSFAGTIAISGLTATANGTGPSGGWTMTGSGGNYTCVIQPAPTWTITSDGHETLNPGTAICNGVSYPLPSYSQ